MRWSNILGFLGFLGFILTLVLIFAPLNLAIDFPSLIVIIGITMPILLTSGLSKDFFKSFKILNINENPYSIVELKKMNISISLAIKLIAASGILASFFGIIASLSLYTDLTQLFNNISVALIATLYSIIFIICLLPIKAKINAILSTLE